jgi:hypothetical protein
LSFKKSGKREKSSRLHIFLLQKNGTNSNAGLVRARINPQKNPQVGWKRRHSSALAASSSGPPLRQTAVVAIRRGSKVVDAARRTTPTTTQKRIKTARPTKENPHAQPKQGVLNDNNKTRPQRGSLDSRASLLDTKK